MSRHTFHVHADSDVADRGPVHDHFHGSPRDREAQRRRMRWVLGITAVFMVAEVVGGFLSNSLALLAELIYDTKRCRKDPATYSYAHGGKDGHPFPVERTVYDRNIALLEDAVRKATVPGSEKDHALRRLHNFLTAQPAS